MGANAQTSVPAFTAGQVLTAAQDTGINTGIPVFASSTERDAAFGGTGEKTLAEGQMAYLEDTNETQYYDGAAWASIGGGGGVLQVQSTVKTDSFSTAANGPVDITGLSVSITPSSASSTILVMTTIPTTGGGGVKQIWIKRDSTDIFTTTNSNVFQWTTQSTTDPAVFTIQGIDSPATTSAVTYKVQIGTSGANTVRVGTDSAGRTDYMASSITVMEIA